jgi:hypothetical protein
MISTASISHLLPSRKESKLESLGLSRVILKQAIGAGLLKYCSASKLAPLNAGGSEASFAIIQMLREQLLSNNGWMLLNQHGQSLTVNPDLQISIVVTSGDKDTGLPDGRPCTKNGKGSETKNQIRQNIMTGQTFNLFDDESEVAEKETNVDNHVLWVLLYHFDPKKKEVRYELSLPVGFKDVGTKGKVKVSNWTDRLHFDPIPFNDITVSHEPTDFNDEIEFSVTPKT